MGGVRPFSLYIQLFASASKQDAVSFKKRFSSKHQQDFALRINYWKTNNNWTNLEVSALILYCHYHNPLNAESLTYYGNLDHIGKCVPLFKRWYIENDSNGKISTDGILKAVVSTAPKGKYMIEERIMTPEELEEVYGRHKP